MRTAGTSLVTALVVLALPACGESADQGEEQTARTRLSIAVRDGEGGVKRATLRCAGGDSTATGFLRRRNARRLCARAEEIRGLLRSAEDDPQRICTQIYGSAHTARIRGRVAGAEVDRRFHRSDGCGIADWRRAKRLLGGEPRGPGRLP